MQSFNPRARAGRDQYASYEDAKLQSFNPRARAGRDQSSLFHRSMERTVSIHAPVRGATWFLWQARSQVYVSIHAPVRGATKMLPFACHSTASFNPRARAGRDKINSSRGLMMLKFQSTRPCGARLDGISSAFGGLLFQSTRPCGARRGECGFAIFLGDVSIHAPVRGAT